MKMKMMERKQDFDEKLASNKMELAERVVKVLAGEDNRWTILHDARFLAGAACSASRLWLAARKKIGVTEIKKSRNQGFSYFFAFFDGRSRIREAQIHKDLDPQHWFVHTVLFRAIIYRTYQLI